MAELLTARSVAKLRPSASQYDVWDAHTTGLGARVAPSGTTTWTVRYRVDGRRLRRLTLGRYPRMSLANARKAARAALRNVDAGGDPAAAKSARRQAVTVAELAADYVERHARRKKKSWKDDERILRAEVLPRWRHRPASEITRRDVRDLVEAIADRGAPILANRVVALLSKLFKFGLDEEVVQVSPAVRITRPGVERQRDRVLSDDEIRQFWTASEALTPAMAAAFRLRLLTAQRGGEVFAMRWPDVDLENATWTIPAAISKNKLPHRVPLSAPALAILTALRADADAKPIAPAFVLQGARGKRQRSAAAVALGLSDFVGHDLRRTAASRMASAGIQRFVIGRVLNHVERSVTAVYDRHGYDAEKRTAMDEWARELDRILTATPGGQRVVPMRTKRGG